MSHRPFDTDVLFEMLANERRRRLLVDLLERPQLPETVHAPGSALVAGALGRAHVELYHVHLPKLESSGLVRWDRAADEVTAGPQFERTRPVLELLTEHAGALPSGWG